MKSNISLKLSIIFTITISLMLSLVACIPEQISTSQPSISPTLEVLPSQNETQIPTSLPTSTSSPQPTATSTPEPVADLHDISTWPIEMQEYFNRDPGEWNNPSKHYASDVDFHRFILQARRDFLTANGVGEAGSMDRDALLLEYLKWGNQNKQILVLTPIELRSWYADPTNIGVAYKHILPNNSGVQFFEGLFVNTNLQDNNDKMKDLVGFFLSDSFRIPIFGQEVLVPRYAYNGVGGDELGLFHLTGIPNDQGIGVLVHYVNDKGDHCYQPLATHFITLTINKGDLVYNAGGIAIAQIEADIVMGAAHIGALGGYNSIPIVLDDLIKNIGLKIAIRPDWGSDAMTQEIFPWNFGLEGGQTFDFEQSPFNPPTVYPWSQP